MKIAVIGSREGFTEEFVHKKLAENIESYMTYISGGARGVDSFAESFAKKNGYAIKIIKPIDPSSKIDYLFRNVEIITEADKIIAFWSGVSSGTKFVIDYAKARNKDIIIIKSGGD